MYDNDECSGAKKGDQKWVQLVVDALQKRHGKKYTCMQYHLWAEMVSDGMHKSMTNAPIFKRCGGEPSIRTI